ncbi:MAG: hypothetical protein DHS20C16_15670 [Phycisphaerae bacterium]|nr:MAG: hypothetical protein DHS20C16_15670 [Phycisphaerae bacterium]
MIGSANQDFSLTVHIGKGTLEEIVERSTRDSPRETCGLLLGRRDGQVILVRASVPARNVSPEPNGRYEIDPHIVLRQLASDVHAEADCMKPRLIGFYHSHPRGSVEPSDQDHAEAWPDMLNLIVGSQENQNRWTFFWHDREILYATVVDRRAIEGPALTRFSQGSTITLHRSTLRPGWGTAELKSK